ncbi:Hypothetical_protein [Hexamita inflata]|uniref:Hypothetical_protein n=1 Tax=Hexamita inflata TaxID=28002 RepID=A0ABP1H4D7_9EUKA
MTIRGIRNTLIYQVNNVRQVASKICDLIFLRCEVVLNVQLIIVYQTGLNVQFILQSCVQTNMVSRVAALNASNMRIYEIKGRGNIGSQIGDLVFLSSKVVLDTQLVIIYQNSLCIKLILESSINISQINCITVLKVGDVCINNIEGRYNISSQICNLIFLRREVVFDIQLVVVYQNSLCVKFALQSCVHISQISFVIV